MFFTIPPAVFRANVFCTDLQEDDVTPFTFTSQSAQLKNSTNTAGWAQKPSLQVLQLLSSMPTPPCLQRTDKGSARPQAHAPVRQCHRCDVTRRQIITYAIYAWPLPPVFYRWRIAWGQANKLGKLQGMIVFPDHGGWWDKCCPWEELCWDSTVGSSQRAALPDTPQASPPCSQGRLSCAPRSSWKATAQTTVLPLGPSWLSCNSHGLTTHTWWSQPTTAPQLSSCISTC